MIPGLDSRLRRPGFLLLACQPKSGSTFVTNVLSGLPACRSVRLVPGYDRREQELSEARIRRYRFRASRHHIAQAHVRRSAPTDRLIARYGLKVVVLLRDPLDTVVSMRDHIRKESVHFPFAHFSDAHRDWSDAQLDLAIARLVMPWVLNFRLSWAGHETALRIPYEDLAADPVGTVSRIAEHAGIAAPAAELRDLAETMRGPGSRFNVGVAGRGQTLGAEVKQAIAALGEAYPTSTEAEAVELDAFRRAALSAGPSKQVG